jgi:hypothetical protein
VTDLRDLKQDIDNMHLAPPPIHDIIDLVRRGHKRRAKTRLSMAAALLAVERHTRSSSLRGPP